MNPTNRTFSRVRTRLKAYFRLAEPDTLPMHLGCLGCEEQKVNIEDLRSPHLPKEFFVFLLNMDSKLNMLLNILSSNRLTDEYPYQGEIIELSGAGLKFRSDLKLKAGTFLEMAIAVSSLPPKLIGVVGELIRIEQLNEKNVYVLKYSAIRESDREQIVQFVFQEQREALREQRLNPSDQEKDS